MDIPQAIWSVTIPAQTDRVLVVATTRLSSGDTSSGELLRSLAGHSEAIRSIAFLAPDKTMKLTLGSDVSSDNAVKLWNLSSGKLPFGTYRPGYFPCLSLTDRSLTVAV